MVSAWQVLPSGAYVPLTASKALVIDFAALVEDLEATCEDFHRIRAELIKTAEQARRLISEIRRNRLQLRLVRPPV